MRTTPLMLLLLAGLLLAVPATSAQSSNQATIDKTDRLYLGFAEEAALVDRQWWEGRIEFLDGDGFDATILRGTAAFQPWDGFELGGTVGFGDSDNSGLGPDGSGATDLDLWGKFHFGERDGTDFAAGVKLIVPTGDDTAGLGFDAFGAGGFISGRREMDGWTLAGNLGLNFNDDGRIFGLDVDGETSFVVGAAALVPIGTKTTFVGEARYESERFDGLDSDTRIHGGFNIRVNDGGIFRVGFGLGLTDGAPDGQLTAGYAATF